MKLPPLVRSSALLLCLALAWQSCAAGPSPRGAAEPQLHGRVEWHDGLRVLRLWGTPEQRGYAHGYLLADDITAILREEFAARFARRPHFLQQARRALPRLIEYPDDIAAELTALWQGVVDRGVPLAAPALGRELDGTDLLVANAMDVFGLMGCSSFTVWGDQVAGGGVLTARNFDWPLTGRFLLSQTLLVVQHPADSERNPTASIAWPGYVGAVTGVAADGAAAYLHVGSARIALPEPSSWPSAIAARRILETRATGGARFAAAEALLSYTSPPAGFLTHVVLPAVPAAGVPARMFETDAHRCVAGEGNGGPVVVTNHFRTRTDGRTRSRDSEKRAEIITDGLAGCTALDDRVVDVAEAWQVLGEVARGRRRFGTLHAIVFRNDPWYFELRIADYDDEEGVVAAPASPRRHVLTRAQVFGGGDRPAKGR